ncbi:unnamed protein product [Dibothriocephalus latus]|uniref:Uncharacterized protein n=1 Tax=Dibothriocephalus latus TaxID=60516 RepID=A0A3P6TAY9_DIBLA|nr:unnamed protein product [Dibothriocephalus latus]
MAQAKLPALVLIVIVEEAEEEEEEEEEEELGERRCVCVCVMSARSLCLSLSRLARQGVRRLPHPDVTDCPDRLSYFPCFPEVGVHRVQFDVPVDARLIGVYGF